jgi:hypothetical protein
MRQVATSVMNDKGHYHSLTAEEGTGRGDGRLKLRALCKWGRERLRPLTFLDRNVRVVPTGHAIDGSVDLADEIDNREFR